MTATTERASFASVDPALRPIAEAAMQWLADRFGQWPDHEDGQDEYVARALDACVPTGIDLWELMKGRGRPLGHLPSPGAIADTIEGCVRDSIRDAIWGPVQHWMSSVIAAYEPHQNGSEAPS